MDSWTCGRCKYFYNGQCMEEEQCMRVVDEARYNGIIEGRRDERKKIIEIIDSADDYSQAMYMVVRYLIKEELK